jgi:hypothetical protein
MPTLSRTEDPTPQSRCRFALKWCDITPPANIYHRMWGAAKHERATGIHRPLRATVTVFAPMEGGERQILLALDHCVMGATEHANLVAQAAEIGGVAKDEILVVFSHTHGAGLMGLDRASLPGGDLIQDHSEAVEISRRESGTLRSDVSGGTHTTGSLSGLAHQPHISQTGTAAQKYDVRGFDVPMHQTCPVEGLQSIGHGQAYLDTLCDLQAAPGDQVCAQSPCLIGTHTRSRGLSCIIQGDHRR